MQDVLKKIINNISFFTTHPDVDWKRMFTVLVFITVVSFGWNIYFYFMIQDKIAESEVVQKTRSAQVGTKEDEVQEIIGVYEKKKATQSTLISNKSFRLEDPSVL